MTDQHPINPPPELFKQWENDILSERDNVDHVLDCAWRHGFHAGADHELNACCEWIYKLMDRGLEWSMDLRASRRPKPPSLKDEALKALRSIERGLGRPEDTETIRRALEQLDD